MADIGEEAAIAARVMSQFVATGAEPIAPACLQPAEILLDLYGEDIRARAYTAHDPVDGELMLRPDFTVPVVRTHLQQGRDAARYAYAGPVWRRQEAGSANAREFWQVGYENLGAEDEAAAEADVFARLAEALAGCTAKAVTGDLGFVFAAIRGLETTPARKAALQRHVWRPGRFARLLARFSGAAPFDCDIRDLPDPDPAIDAPGRRSMSDVTARLVALNEDRSAKPISREEVALFDKLFALRTNSNDAIETLRTLAETFPALSASVEAMSRRLDALQRKGFEPATLAFDGGFGRQTMEYYEGFVFAFQADGDKHPAVATGGRYDALTRALGGGTGVAAVGGVVRPGVLAALLAAS